MNLGTTELIEADYEDEDEEDKAEKAQQRAILYPQVLKARGIVDKAVYVPPPPPSPHIHTHRIVDVHLPQYGGSSPPPQDCTAAAGCYSG